MLALRLHKNAGSFLAKIPAKHARQISEKIVLLRQSPDKVASTELKGFPPFRRCKSGEYRIIYRIDDTTLNVSIIGKRNDDEVYKQLRRFLR